MDETIKFYHVTQRSQSLGVFAASSPKEAVWEVAKDASPGNPVSFLQLCSPNYWAGMPQDFAERLLSEGRIVAEDMSEFSPERLDIIAKGRGLSDWGEFLELAEDCGRPKTRALAALNLSFGASAAPLTRI